MFAPPFLRTLTNNDGGTLASLPARGTQGGKRGDHRGGGGGGEELTTIEGLVLHTDDSTTNPDQPSTKAVQNNLRIMHQPKKTPANRSRAFEVC